MCATEELALGLKGSERGGEVGAPGLEPRLLRGNVPLRVEPLVLSKAGPETPETA